MVPSKVTLLRGLFNRDAQRNLVGVVFVVGLFVIPLLSHSLSVQSAAAQAALMCIATFSVTVLFGMSGQLMFAQGVIFGTAAYLSGYLSIHGAPSIVAVLGGIAGATALGTSIMIPASRLSRLQLGLLTFAMGAAGVEVFAKISGYDGLGGIPLYRFGSLQISTPVEQLGLTCVVLLVVFALLEIFRRSKIGRQFLLLKAHPATLAATGKNPVVMRLTAYALASFLLGIGGALYPAVTGYIGPNVFDFTFVITLLLGAVLGGMMILEGAILGGIAVGILPVLFSNYGNWFTLTYGLLIVAILIIWPAGLMSLMDIRLPRRKLHEQLLQTVTPEHANGTEPATGPAPRVAARHAGTDTARALATSIAPGRSPGGKPLLSVSQVTKSFGGMRVLDSVKFDLYQGGVIGLIGSNGAGKSTLVNVLCGELRPDEAERIDFDGRSVLHASTAARAALGLCRTFQFPSFASELDAVTNIRLGVGKKKFNPSSEAAEHIMEVGGISEVARLRPDSVPQGQQKIMDVCRVLARRPKLVFLDEPAAGLGPAELPELGALLQEAVSNDTTIVMVEHNMEFLMRLAHRVIVLDSGRVIADGSPESVGKEESVQRAYLGGRPVAHSMVENRE